MALQRRISIYELWLMTREWKIHRQINSLKHHLKEEGYTEFEGNTSQIARQVIFLAKLVRSKNVTRILEIGFNAGHGAIIFLAAKTTVNVTNFDIGHHPYTPIANQFINKMYAGRHTLILGNSIETIPQYHDSKPNHTFDLIFIDGGHDQITSQSDLSNCKSLAHSNTIVMLDDTVTRPDWIMPWNEGPNIAWRNMISSQLVTEFGSVDCCRGRGYSWGKYNNML